MADLSTATESADTDTDTDTEFQSDIESEVDSPVDTVRDASDVGEDVSRAAWAEAARERLVEAAGNYRAVVTHKELADHVQAASGIHTTQRVQHWIGDVLQRVTQECGTRDEPDLASLCVNASGSVGDGYADSVEASSGERPADPDRHAAHVRLECYGHFGAELPADGGLAALTPKLEASRARTKKAAIAARPVNMCPVCFMSIPPNGTCVNCE